MSSKSNVILSIWERIFAYAFRPEYRKNAWNHLSSRDQVFFSRHNFRFNFQLSISHFFFHPKRWRFDKLWLNSHFNSRFQKLWKLIDMWTGFAEIFHAVKIDLSTISINHTEMDAMETCKLNMQEVHSSRHWENSKENSKLNAQSKWKMASCANQMWGCVELVCARTGAHKSAAGMPGNDVNVRALRLTMTLTEWKRMD